MAQLKHIPPNFTINGVKGWNSRLLYTFYGNASNPDFDYYAQTGDYTINLFSAIADWQQTNGAILSKGQYNYPQYSYFFKTGKSIRVKGTLLIDADAATFNIRASIKNVTDNSVWAIARPNNGNDHTVGKGGVHEKMPVNFEITYGCIEDNSNNLYFQANGFYQYEFSDYNSEGSNVAVAYVPIWNSTQFTNVGTNDDNYELHISFDNSNRVDPLVIRHLTIEELS